MRCLSDFTDHEMCNKIFKKNFWDLQRNLDFTVSERFVKVYKFYGPNEQMKFTGNFLSKILPCTFRWCQAEFCAINASWDLLLFNSSPYHYSALPIMQTCRQTESQTETHTDRPCKKQRKTHVERGTNRKGCPQKKMLTERRKTERQKIGQNNHKCFQNPAFTSFFQ